LQKEGDELKKLNITEAIDEIGITKRTWFVFGLLGITMLINNYVFGLASYTKAQIAKEWHLTPVQTGAVSSWMLLGLVVGSSFSGLISDRFGRKKTIIGAVSIFAIISPFVYLAPDFTTYSILRFITGCGIGATMPVCLTLMSEYAPVKRRGVLITSTMAFYLFGGVVTGSVALNVIPNYGWRMMYLLGSVALILVVPLAAFLRESPIWLATHGREQEALETVKALEKSAGKEPSGWSIEDLVISPPMKKSGLAALFVPEYRKQTIGLWLLYFFCCVVLYSIMAWMPTLLYTVKGLSLSLSYKFAMSQNVAASIACVLTGLVADKIGRRGNVYLGYILVILALPLLAFANSTMVLFLGVFCVGFAINYVLNSVQPILTEYYRPEIRNTGVSFASAFGRIGGFAGPLLIGFLKQQGLSFQATILCLLIPVLVGMLIIKFLVTEETKGKKAYGEILNSEV
jgi:putative MFS transporter